MITRLTHKKEEPSHSRVCVFFVLLWGKKSNHSDEGRIRVLRRLNILRSLTWPAFRNNMCLSLFCQCYLCLSSLVHLKVSEFGSTRGEWLFKLLRGVHGHKVHQIRFWAKFAILVCLLLTVLASFLCISCWLSSILEPWCLSDRVKKMKLTWVPSRVCCNLKLRSTRIGFWMNKHKVHNCSQSSEVYAFSFIECNCKVHTQSRQVRGPLKDNLCFDNSE